MHNLCALAKSEHKQVNQHLATANCLVPLVMLLTNPAPETTSAFKDKAGSYSRKPRDTNFTKLLGWQKVFVTISRRPASYRSASTNLEANTARSYSSAAPPKVIGRLQSDLDER